MSPHIDCNRVAIITGLSQGIGQSIAKDFAISGFNVLVTSPNEQELKNIVATCCKHTLKNIGYFW